VTRRDSGLLEQRAIPARHGNGSTRERIRAPHDGERAPRTAVRLRSLRVLDGVRARTFGVEQAQETFEIDRLSRCVEDVARFRAGDLDRERLARAVEV